MKLKIYLPLTLVVLFGTSLVTAGPIHDAINLGKNIEDLLKSNQDRVNDRDHNGNTPLHLAALYGNLETLKLLIEKGANVSAKNSQGKTPLHIPASLGRNIGCEEQGHPDTIKLLIEKGADINAKDNSGKTPLDYASEGYLIRKQAGHNDSDCFLKILQAFGNKATGTNIKQLGNGLAIIAEKKI